MTKLFPESEDEEDNAVCTDIASRDEVVPPTAEAKKPCWGEAEELSDSMNNFRSKLCDFIDSMVAENELLSNRIERILTFHIQRIDARLENHLEMIKTLKEKVDDNDYSNYSSFDEAQEEIREEVERTIKDEWLQEEVERLVREEINDDMVFSKDDYENKFDEMFGKIGEQFRKLDESLAKVLKK